MGVFIKSMEMPNNCYDCPFIRASYAGDYYCAKGKGDEDDLKKLYSQRMADCPLVEIPTPHGRLIAEKTITEIRYHDADGYHIVNGEQLCELEIDAETVIEEGETDGR